MRIRFFKSRKKTESISISTANVVSFFLWRVRPREGAELAAIKLASSC